MTNQKELPQIQSDSDVTPVANSQTRYESSILWFAAIWFFLILFSYYILRPIREQIGATYGVSNLSWLFGVTFIVMLIAIPVYSILVGRFDRKILVPTIYLVFVACLILFWAGMKVGSETIQVWIARAFFVWISVFGLFIVSFFWSVVGDMFSTAQGRRLFGYISGGGTVGSLIGSQVAGRLVGRIGVANLLLFPAILLVVALFVYLAMERVSKRVGVHGAQDQATNSGKATGGNPFAGFTKVFQSRYLFAICLFGVLMATCGTMVYFQQAEIVKATYADVAVDESRIEDRDRLSETEFEAAAAKLRLETSKEASTEYFANVNFAVSIVTLIFQLLIVGWLMKRIGLGATLAVLPMAYLIGVTALAISPTIEILAVVSVIGRAAEYGISNPTREVLFTSVNREDRYKAKSFIDTVVRRGGDSAVGSIYQALRGSFGFALSTLSWIVLPIALLWAGLAVFIGAENKRLVATTADSGAREN